MKNKKEIVVRNTNFDNDVTIKFPKRHYKIPKGVMEVVMEKIYNSESFFVQVICRTPKIHHTHNVFSFKNKQRYNLFLKELDEAIIRQERLREKKVA